MLIRSKVINRRRKRRFSRRRQGLLRGISPPPLMTGRVSRPCLYPWHTALVILALFCRPTLSVMPTLSVTKTTTDIVGRHCRVLCRGRRAYLIINSQPLIGVNSRGSWPQPVKYAKLCLTIGRVNVSIDVVDIWRSFPLTMFCADLICCKMSSERIVVRENVQ